MVSFVAAPLRMAPMRRLLITFLALVAGFPVLGATQSRVARVAVLTVEPVSSPAGAPGWRAFTDALRDRGWIEGRNLALDVRATEGRADRFREFAAQLVALRPDVIVGVTTQGVQAAREHTTTIPIVMRGVADPIAAGFVASLARPGGNVTGVSTQIGDLNEKFLQLLREARPGITRVVLLWTPDNAGSRRSKEITAAVAPTLGIALEPIGVNSPEELDKALGSMARHRPDALLVHATPVLQVHNRATIAFALKQRLPSLTHSAQMARDGLLLSYAPDLVEEWRVVAGYVDRILRGAKPAELPVEQPTKFQFVVNLKTARAIGIEIPSSLLGRADEVIE
jgi:putative ABC transport system substrate-binding protein